MDSAATPGSDHVFIVDWFQHSTHPQEVHALAVQLDDTTGLYGKVVLRVDFPDFAYILFAEDPEPAMIDRARKAVSKPPIGATIQLTKVKTIAGYQAEATVPALAIKAADLSLVFKTPEIKALAGYVEEHTVVSRSRKLTAFRGMAQCCWVPLAGFEVVAEGSPQRVTKTGIKEYKVPNWEKLSGMPLDTRAAFTPPPGSAVKVLSFDIEVYKPSQRRGGMPDPTDRANFVLCISVIVHQESLLAARGSGRREITLHTVFDVMKREEYLPPGTVVYRYATEYEMIRGFWDQIASDDPLLILGFNVQSWDYRYIHERMKLHGITYPSSLSIYNRPAAKIELRRSHWSSDAFKHNDLLWPDIPGVVTLDLHKFYVRSRPQLRKHSLDFISRYYLGRGKYPVSQERMVRAYESQDSHELSAMAQYNVEDSMLVLDLFLRQQVFAEAALEALTSESLIDDLYTKGLQLRALNKLYRYAKEDRYVMTTSAALSIARGQGGEGGESRLVGALVMSPAPGRYDDVAIYDIRSMYPTLLLSRNICFTTFLGEPDASSPEHVVFPWETKSGDENKPHDLHHAAFVTDRVRRGICTRLLADQIILRDQIKSWGPSGSDLLKYAQRGVKAVSNSIIGLMAAHSDTSKLSFPAAAGVVYTAARTAITAIIQDVTQWQGDKHGPVVYSDTDSVLVAGMKTPEVRAALLGYLNGRYQPFIFELENIGRLLLVGPKNYILRLEDGSLVYKGVSFSKRDASDYVAQAMREVTGMIMDGAANRADILAYVKTRTDAVKGEEPDVFVMSATVSLSTRSVGGKLARRLIANGAILMPGDVVEYVVLTRPIGEAEGCAPESQVVPRRTAKPKKVTASGVTERTATLEELFACLGDGVIDGKHLSVDFDYYVDKLRSSVERLLVFDA